MPALTFLADLVCRRSGLNLGPDKQYLLEARLAPIVRHAELASLDALAAELEAGRRPELEQAVAEAMATHETLFFRDAKPFDHLRTAAIPALLRNRPRGAPLRIWSAAAATGQEAYSIAMTALEAGLEGRQCLEIIATDFAAGPLARAQAARYTQYEVQRGLSIQRLLKHFNRVGEEWEVKPNLRAPCCFRQHNLLDDASALGQFDIVFCRNVLFYFDIPTKTRVLDAITRQMAPDGLLYLGAAETTMGLCVTLQRDGPSHTRPGSRATAAA